ncbi:MAG: tRNA (adenosine(37)-N6)-dimethylallyltransferase MiaA [Planctomycetota bacterium]
MADLGGRTAYFLVGPTASGKGRLARALALRFSMEIVSMDSMKVYRGMDIGTAKPGAEERAAVPHHMIDVVSPHEPFDLARWIDGAEKALLDVTSRGRKALFCGGTGLYLKGILSGIFEGPSARASIRETLEAEADAKGLPALHDRLAALDPAAGKRIHPRDRKRIFRALEVIQVTGEPISGRQIQFDGRRNDLVALLVGIQRDPEDLKERIDRRLQAMMDAGFLEEVRTLLERSLSRSASQALGYRELAAHLEGETTLEEAVETALRNTRRFVKRQRAWLRRFEEIDWLQVTGESDDEATVRRAANAFSLVPEGELP